MEMDAVFENAMSDCTTEAINEKQRFCLTPSTFDDNISMIAMKGSITLSIEDIDDDLATTMSGLTTPLVSVDEVENSDKRLKKKMSLFDEDELDETNEMSTLHASINIPAASCQFLKHDARLRKFETITQSTSNSNFPFESNTLKRDPKKVIEFIDVTHTQSCINLKSSVSPTPNLSASNSPQHKHIAAEGNRETDMLREKFKERPKSISREFHGKTQSMDSDLNEFLLIPTHAPTQLQSSSQTTTKRNQKNRFITAKVEDDYYKK